MDRTVPLAVLAIAAVAAAALGVVSYAQQADPPAPPEFESAVLNSTTGILTIDFGKELDATARDLSKLHIREQGHSTGGVTLNITGIDLLLTPARETIPVLLDAAALAAVNGMATPVIDIDAGAVTDTAGMRIGASADNALVVLDDDPPKLVSAVIDNSTEFTYIYIHFDEQIDPFSADGSKLRIRDPGTDTSVTLNFDNAAGKGHGSYVIPSVQFGSNGTGDEDLWSPSDVAVNSTGHVFVADSQNHRVQIFNPDGTSAGKIDEGMGSDDQEMAWPRGIAVDGNDRILVADTNNNRTKIYYPNATFIKNIGVLDNGTKQLTRPHGVASNDTHIFVADTDNNRVRVFDYDGVHQFDSQPRSAGSETYMVIEPHSVAVTSDNRILAASTGADDRGGNIRSVWVFYGNGTFMDFVGGSAGGTLSFDTVQGVAVDGFDRTWATDSSKNRTVVIEHDIYDRVYPDAGGFDRMFDSPRGITVDSAGSVYVADTGNGRVLKMDFASTGLAYLPRGFPDHRTLPDNPGILLNMTNPVLDISAGAITDTAGNPIGASDGNNVIRTDSRPVLANVTLTPSGGTVGLGGSLVLTFTSEPGLRTHPGFALVTSEPPDSGDSLDDSPTGFRFHDVAVKTDGIDETENPDGTSTYKYTYTVTEQSGSTLDGQSLFSVVMQDASRIPSAPINMTVSGLGIDASKAAVTLNGEFNEGLVYLNFSSPVSVSEVSRLQIIGDGPSDMLDLSSEDVTLSTAGEISYVLSLNITTGRSGLTFDQPSDIAIHNGSIIVADSDNDSIHIFGPMGGPQNLFQYVDQDNTDSLSWPRSVAVNATGHIFVADTSKHRAHVLLPNGTLLATFGDGTNGNGPEQLDTPEAIAVDATGRVFVADKNDRVQVLSPGGERLQTLNFTNELTLDDPRGIEVNATHIFISDTNNNVVKIFDKDGGHVRTLDPPGDDALSAPRALAVGPDGSLFVADTNKHRIAVLDASDGTLLYDIGEAGSGDVQFNKPRGVEVGPDGRVYVADTDNNSVQVLDPAASEFTFKLNDAALNVVRAMENPRIEISTNIVSADGIALLQSYKVGLDIPAPDDGEDAGTRPSVAVAVPEVQDRIPVTRSGSGGGGGIIVSDSIVSGIGDGAKSVLYRAYWETSDDGSSRTLYIVAGQDGGGIPHVRVNAPESGRTDAAVSASQPYPGRTLFEVQLLPSDSFVMVYVGDAQQKLFQLDDPDGDVTVMQYSGPDGTSTAMEEKQDMTEMQPDMTEESDAGNEEQPPAMEEEPPLQPRESDSGDGEAMTPENGAMEGQGDGQVVDPEPPAPAGADTDADTAADTPGDGGCLIATAAYGTELAPQVQALREVRDGTLAGTSSGAAFMGAFNSMYYAFSPAVADLQREHPELRGAVRVLITPMLYTLGIMDAADGEASVLALGLSVIALNAGMYVAAPTLAGYAVVHRLRANR